MFERRIPEWLRHAPAPSIKGFAAISGFEAVTRGMLISIFPVAVFDALQSASRVSSIMYVPAQINEHNAGGFDADIK